MKISVTAVGYFYRAASEGEGSDVLLASSQLLIRAGFRREIGPFLTLAGERVFESDRGGF